MGMLVVIFPVIRRHGHDRGQPPKSLTKLFEANIQQRSVSISLLAIKIRNKVLIWLLHIYRHKEPNYTSCISRRNILIFLDYKRLASNLTSDELTQKNAVKDVKAANTTISRKVQHPLVAKVSRENSTING